MPLGKPGRLIALYGAHSESTSILDSLSIADINIVGNATVLGVRYIYQLPLRQQSSRQVTLGLDYKRIGKSDAPGDPGTILLKNRVHYAPVSVSYLGFHPNNRGTTKFYTTFRANIAGLVPGGREEDFGGDDADPESKPGNRVGSSGTFVVFQAGFEHFQNLPEGFNLSLKLDGQVVSEPLISVEQYFAGGAETVRGYLENEVLGDDAVHGSLEIQTPPLSKILPNSVKENLRLSAFYDAARLWVRDALPGEKERFHLSSAGLGLQLRLTNYAQARLDQAWALRDGIITQKGDSFTHFSLKMSF
jgi:hemolysin activation/secretion protein